MRPVLYACRYICPRCLNSPTSSYSVPRRNLTAAHTTAAPRAPDSDPHDEALPKSEKSDQGAMSRRLSELGETNLEQGGSAARTAVEQSGFDEDLKRRLLDRIEDADFRKRNASAFAEMNMPSSAGQGSRHHAAARPWDGQEQLEDAALRMLNDAHKPLRRPFKVPSPTRPPKKVDTGRPKNRPNTGIRLANARDRTTIYSYLKDDSMTEKEREEHRKILKDRFQPAARPLPGTLQGLAALANERIEDAIARGQFKNLPRGKAITRDSTADSPFLDTTEYFMNKIIKKQEIVPPWIEKQQELIAAATQFRNRLRADWKRHAARVIASKGGALEVQVRAAESYALAESLHNPARQVEKMNTVDSKGHMSQITLTGELKTSSDGRGAREPVQKLTVREDDAAGGDVKAPSGDDAASSTSTEFGGQGGGGPTTPQPRTPQSMIVFRDLEWIALERPYLVAAIADLNSKARSYNLMAPNSAKKPYFTLERELATCYADVAPQLPHEIRERAKAPKVQVEVFGGSGGSILGSLGSERARVYDERRPRYGLREFFRDLVASRP